MPVRDQALVDVDGQSHYDRHGGDVGASVAGTEPEPATDEPGSWPMRQSSAKTLTVRAKRTHSTMMPQVAMALAIQGSAPH